MKKRDEKVSGGDIHLRLHPGIKAAFVAACEADDRTPSQMVRKLIKAWLDGRQEMDNHKPRR